LTLTFFLVHASPQTIKFLKSYFYKENTIKDTKTTKPQFGALCSGRYKFQPILLKTGAVKALNFIESTFFKMGKIILSDPLRTKTGSLSLEIYQLL
jgi:hypothetical protein